MIVVIRLFAFGYEDNGPDTFKWTKLFGGSEVKKLHDMLQELDKKLDQLQEVYLWRNLHETDIQSTTIRLAANSHASFIGCKCGDWNDPYLPKTLRHP